MSSRWFWGLLVLFLVAGIGAGLLYRRYKGLLNTRLTESKPAVQTFGSVVITDTRSGPATDWVIKSAVINKLVVDSYELDVIELGRERTPVLKTRFLFDYDGKQKALSVDLFEGITYLEVSPGTGEDGVSEKKDVRLADIKLNKGDPVNLSVSYVPVPGPDSVDEVRSKCELINNLVCLRLIEAGFGRSPIDFDEYLKGLLANSDEVVLDYKKVIPRAIYVIRQPTE